jgi:hypothetical protein
LTPITISKQQIFGRCTAKSSYDVPSTTKIMVLQIPDVLYVIPMAYTPPSSPGAINNFPAFSRSL